MSLKSNYRDGDSFSRKSKEEGYRSRASFKLIELNKKFKFLKNNTNLLDLGSYPGGWSQVATEIITSGRLMAVDIKEMKDVKNVKFVKGDIFESKIKDEIEKSLSNLDQVEVE